MSVIIRCDDKECPLCGETFCKAPHVNIEIKMGETICHTKAQWMNKPPKSGSIILEPID